MLIPLSLVQEYAVSFMDKSVYGSHFDVLGFHFQLQRDDANQPSVSVRDTAIKVGLPLKFNFTKSEGLFSVSGGGALLFHISLQFKSEQGNIIVCSHLDSYEWTDQPRLHMGILSIPLEYMANQVIDTFKIKYLREFDDYFNQKNLISETAGKLLHQYGNQLKISNAPELYFHTQVEQITLGSCREENGYVSTPLQITCTNTINDRKEYFDVPDTPAFKILNHQQAITPSPFSVKLECKYTTIATYLKHTLQNLTLGGKTFEVSSIKIEYRDQLLIDIHLTAPISGKCKFFISPEFDVINGMIKIKHIHVNVLPESFLYKLTAPLLEKFLVNKIREHFPLDISGMVLQMIRETAGKNTNKKLNWKVGNADVDQFSLNSRGIQLSVSCREWYFEDQEKGITVSSALA